jgi:hypothetical protein
LAATSGITEGSRRSRGGAAVGRAGWIGGTSSKPD